MTLTRDGVAWAAVAVLAAASVYEILVATEVLQLGDLPGQGAAGQGAVLTAALLSYVLGAAVAFAGAISPIEVRSFAWPLLPAAGASYLVAHWTSFDPYYAPTLRRYSEGGITGPWIVGVVAAAACAALVAALAPRLGSVLVALVLLVEALTVFVMPLGT